MLVLGGFAGLKGGAHATADAPPKSGITLHSVDVTVETAAGEPVLLTFEVRAPDQAHAELAARVGVTQVAPGSTIVQPAPGTVSAQWARWSWLWDDSELPVPIAYNPTDAPPSVSPQLLMAAMQTWSAVPTSKFAFRYAGITDLGASMFNGIADGENVISWAKLDCATGCILGVTSKRTVHEADLVLNSDPAAEIGDGQAGTIDARTIILHELGHIAGLAHSCPEPFGPCTDAERGAIMYFQYLGIRRSLGQDDITAISTLYPRTSPPPSTTPSPRASPTPPAPVFPVVLESGWNLVALPPGDVSGLAASLACTTAIYDYRDGSWAEWVPGAPAGVQTLASLDAGRAYWVLASGSCAHEFGG